MFLPSLWSAFRLNAIIWISLHWLLVGWELCVYLAFSQAEVTRCFPQCCMARICPIPMEMTNPSPSMEALKMIPGILKSWGDSIIGTFSFSCHSAKNDIAWFTLKSSRILIMQKAILAWFMQALKVYAGRCWWNAFMLLLRMKMGTRAAFSFPKENGSMLSAWGASLRMLP